MVPLNKVRGYHWCPLCHQQRWDEWIESGKCTVCGTEVEFIKDTSIPTLDQATNQELINELCSRDDASCRIEVDENCGITGKKFDPDALFKDSDPNSDDVLVMAPLIEYWNLRYIEHGDTLQSHPVANVTGDSFNVTRWIDGFVQALDTYIEGNTKLMEDFVKRRQEAESAIGLSIHIPWIIYCLLCIFLIISILLVFDVVTGGS